jgi:hypothetical protein
MRELIQSYNSICASISARSAVIGRRLAASCRVRYRRSQAEATRRGGQEGDPVSPRERDCGAQQAVITSFGSIRLGKGMPKVVRVQPSEV